jgi:membrane-associated phospholipid phosphatase
MTQFEKTFHFMKKPGVIVFYAILVLLSYIFVDRALATYFHGLDLRTSIHFLRYLTALGQWMGYIVLFFIAAVYFRFIQANPVYAARSLYLLSCVFIANLVCLVVKVTLSRARPDLLFASGQFGFYWFKSTSNYWSFPSGHTSTIISVASGLGIVFPRYFYVLLSLALLVAASRVLLYHHYLSDVMTGFYLSLMVVGLFTQYLKGKKWFTKKCAFTS